MPAAPVTITEAQTVDQDTSESVESDAVYGPWMVVS